MIGVELSELTYLRVNETKTLRRSICIFLKSNKDIVVPEDEVN